MPTYKAAGVSAWLTIPTDNPPDVQDDNLEEMTERATIINTLREQPFSVDGKSIHAIQFIGTDSDIPFFLVEAHQQLFATSLLPHLQIPTTNLSPSPSPSCTGTPTPMANWQNLDKIFLDAGQKDWPVDITADTSLLQPRARTLALTVEIKGGLWWSISASERHLATAMIEVFQDGQPIDTAFASKKEEDQALHFTIELPSDANCTEHKWKLANESLQRMATGRMMRRSRMKLVSAKYVEVLSDLNVPSGLESKVCLAIIDVIVTSDQSAPSQTDPSTDGEGALPSRTSCNPLSDSSLSRVASPVPKVDFEPSLPVKADKAVQSLAKRITSREKTMALAREHGLENCLNHTVDNYPKRRGQMGKKRSVYHRLVDMQKMSEQNRAVAFRALKSQLAEQMRQASGDEGASWDSSNGYAQLVVGMRFVIV